MTYLEALKRRDEYIAIGALDARIQIAVFGRTEEEHLYTVTPVW